MTTNKDRAAEAIDRWTKQGGELNSAVGSPHEIAELLAAAGLLMPDDMTTEYGYSCYLDTLEEFVSWGDLESSKNVRRNMQKAGHTCEIIARHVSPHRFITMTEEPKQ